ncbi:hypothetical protein PVAND_017343 [Polypedilum vanderplanki]|uniref:Uncharacterized protein n=1 Tax=Polypedilum vanderplanki TaxID=319348 RepID=A0A9J6BIE9_POLVA|nr:hypothetical protein PVAND_017343 [Polypedilum vanderplanki]
MKLITGFFVKIFVINLTYSSELPPTLNEIKISMMEEYKNFGQLADLFKDVKYYQTFKVMSETNQTCLDEKLKLNQNGDKRIFDELAKKAVQTAVILCHAEPDKVLDFSFDMSYQLLKPLIDESFDINCLKSKLHEYDPQSKLLEGFEISQKKIEECNNNGKIKFLIEMSQKEASEICGPEVNAAVKENFKMAIIVKTLEENSEKFNEEKSKQRNAALKIYEKTLKCVLGQYD